MTARIRIMSVSDSARTVRIQIMNVCARKTTLPVRVTVASVRAGDGIFMDRIRTMSVSDSAMPVGT
jgi:hypothetical protein